jgi:hypothetical protein
LDDQADALKVGLPAAPAQNWLGGAAFTLEGFNRFEHVFPRARVHLGPLVEDPVHGRSADAAGFGNGVDSQGKLHPWHK